MADAPIRGIGVPVPEVETSWEELREGPPVCPNCTMTTDGVVHTIESPGICNIEFPRVDPSAREQYILDNAAALLADRDEKIARLRSQLRRANRRIEELKDQRETAISVAESFRPWYLR